MGKYLVSIDGHLSTILSTQEGKYLYIITKEDGYKAVENFCDPYDLMNRNIKIDFNDKIICFEVNWFDSEEEEDWSPMQLHLIEIKKI